MVHPVLLFDGHCLLCSRAVHFVHRNDRCGVFRFAARESPEAERLLRGQLLPPDLDSVMVVEGGRVYTHSDAVLRIVPHLGWRYRWLGVFGVLPRGLRDAMYRWVARRRYRWFGKSEACFLPTPELRSRFNLETPEAPRHPEDPARGA